MSKYLVWIDCEMTGLNPVKDKIIEIACIITDTDLNIIDILDPIAINTSKEIMENMCEWCVNQHSKSGLTQRVLDSKISLTEAESMVVNFIKKYVKEKESPLCGNSIYFDRMFIKIYMPLLDNYLHYRLIDVSTIKELAKLWNPEVKKQFTKDSNHLALDDIIESINELKHYKENFLKNKLDTELQSTINRIFPNDYSENYLVNNFDSSNQPIDDYFELYLEQ